ncbi:uncharacterized protein c(2)M isoform X2 [Drosophila virilis]|uniref:Uncharacterized protein, isoform B n=1 Tax=Drosophila virilis TaxID=7244 RepID=A0A0Q9WGG9_DROVI|nr:uncharacterized protein LOC6627828 isoform X2 [Drosophila virilis]KRF81351.1 uncharacterized protein Dvir_GJ10618, isoform B [Drosophila virilis]
MPLDRINLSANEDINQLKPCWIAGDRKYSNSRFARVFARHEINAIDVAASCDQIRDMIDNNQAKTAGTDNALDTCNRRVAAFNDLTRLTFGVSYILSQQVSTLLDDTKHLLDQIMGNNLEIPCQAEPPRQTQTHGCRKRKRIIATKTTTMCLAKRARIRDPQLLDEQNIDYYRHMLTESQLWNTDTENLEIEQLQTIEVARTCSAQHVISFTHELTMTELGEDILWNDGFGESNPVDVAALEEFLPFRNSLKRKSTDSMPTGVLCYKMPRLATSLDLSNTNGNTQALDLYQEIEPLAPLPPVSPLPPTIVAPAPKPKLKPKFKMIDKCIKLSREVLLRDRELLFNKLESAKHVKPQIIKHSNKSETLLNTFRQDHLFPERLKKHLQLSSEQIELDCEYTIRAIFGEDYSDDLVGEILSAIPVRAQPTNRLEEAPMPMLELAENQSPHVLELQQCSNSNNNNTYEHIKSNEEQNFALSRDGFIKLSAKPKSVEIDAITLGEESVRLIANISTFEQLN